MRPFILLLLIFQLSCNSHSSEEDTKTAVGQQFFDFDRAIHFSTEVTEEKVEALLTKDNLTNTEKYYNEIISGDFPSHLQEVDTNRLAKLSFEKKDLDPSTYSTLRQVFAEKTPSDGVTMSCMPIYRDVIVFISKKKITGLAKICFDCHQYHFLGQKANTETFGSDTDYARLGQILK